MFNHTKDIPFAAGMTAATLFLMRVARTFPSPRVRDVAVFGLLTGATLGMRVLGLLLAAYKLISIYLYTPNAWRPLDRATWCFALNSLIRLLPALMPAYAIMIFAWPWAALAPLNPLRGLLAFSQFHYEIRTLLAGKTYEMADVPRWYVPTYILIRIPLITLCGAAIGMSLTVLPRLSLGSSLSWQKDISLVTVTALFPVACEVANAGPAFTGLRHFLFVIPALSILAGVGFNRLIAECLVRNRPLGWIVSAGTAACFLSSAIILIELHPYEYLFYNSLVGGLKGASRRYDLDYWFDSMPEAVHELEAYVRNTEPIDPEHQPRIYSVAVCGERLSFEKSVTLPQPRFDFMPRWDQSQFFIAPTHMNCDRDLDGKVIGEVERLGVPIAYIKDRRMLTQPIATAHR